jgi:hypothetical protein
MKQHLSIALATALAFTGASGAFAGTMSQNSSSNSMNHSDRMEHATTGSTAPQGKLTLSDSQRKQLWGDLSASAEKQTPPASFIGNVGEAVPSGINTQPLPSQAASDVPTAKNYHYAMLQNRIVLVNPRTNKVAGVIRQQ